ncbi:histidine kinase [Dyadobacter sp. CY261]|uniref:sensor histidine kinase n=1 Tax=Dyadobacter sp. CY261 TaxID=2907203 RepID=UPI001F321F98|nr:sensor histidine kinase [Dyadobacter sp. CY261]MCF0070206.1 histidine kinase [Dyadobacter sp. CY261]
MKPAFFSKYEWWYHLAMMPVCFALGNYYLLGERYFMHLPTFLTASSVALLLYWFSVVALTIVIRRTAGSSAQGQIQQQMLRMFWKLGIVTVFLAIFNSWIYTLVPSLDLTLSGAKIWPMGLMGLICAAFICALLGLFYALQQWKNDQADDEKSARQSAEVEFDALKGQVNPHFLFNSLNTLSSLISANPAQAEDFVEDLARIYRYMLQGARVELVPLQSELSFLEVYIRLLKVRYHDALVVLLPDRCPPDLTIPPLMLQILVDHAVQYNVLSASRPLTIAISLTDDRSILITNNIQMRHRTIGTSGAGLTGLSTKLLTFTARKLEIREGDDTFSVTIPLLPDVVTAPVPG